MDVYGKCNNRRQYYGVISTNAQGSVDGNGAIFSQRRWCQSCSRDVGSELRKYLIDRLVAVVDERIGKRYITAASTEGAPNIYVTADDDVSVKLLKHR